MACAGHSIGPDGDKVWPGRGALANQEVTAQQAHYRNSFQDLLEKLEINHRR